METKVDSPANPDSGTKHDWKPAENVEKMFVSLKEHSSSATAGLLRISPSFSLIACVTPVKSGHYTNFRF
jgi:hypothetical protein